MGSREVEWEWQAQYLKFLRELSTERLTAIESLVNLIEEGDIAYPGARAD